MAPGRGAVSIRTDHVVAAFLDAGALTVHRRLGDVLGVALSMAGEDGGPPTAGASTERAAAVDRLQFDVGAGPSLQALLTGETCYVPDLARDARWGPYGPRAAAGGAAACISVPLTVDGQVVAVVQVFAADVDGLDEGQQDTVVRVAHEMTGGFVLARHLIAQACDLDDIAALMTHRRVIDLALGISMERAQVPADAAFDLLRTQSQRRNLKLHDVAREVVGTVPGTSGADLVAHFNPEG